MPAGTRCARVQKMRSGRGQPLERVLVDVPQAFKVACSIHVFVSVRRHAVVLVDRAGEFSVFVAVVIFLHYDE